MYMITLLITCHSTTSPPLHSSMVMAFLISALVRIYVVVLAVSATSFSVTLKLFLLAGCQVVNEWNLKFHGGS